MIGCLRRMIIPALLLLAVAACRQGDQVASGPTATPYLLFSVDIPCQLEPGQTIPLSLRGQLPAGAEVTWEADAGTISTQTGPVAVYTAPSGVETDVISARVLADPEPTPVTVICTILLPPTATPTFTPTPTATPSPSPSPTATLTPIPSPTPVPTLSPVGCEHFRVAASVFPDFTTGTTFSSENTTYYTCEGVDDPLGERQRVVHVNYEATGDRDDFGSVGFVFGEYDASTFRQLCVSTYAPRPEQAFWLKMKDVSANERQIRFDVPAGGWTEQCVPVDDYVGQGVDVTHLENISAGFDLELGSIELWLDDFVLK